MAPAGEGAAVAEIQYQFLKDFIRYRQWEAAYSQKPGLTYSDHVKASSPPARADIERDYAALFPKPARDGPYSVRYMAHKPYDDGTLPLTNMFLRLISKAEKYIDWGCHGIRPPRIYGAYLAAAVERGVAVRLITNSQRSARTLMLNGLMGWMYWECTKHYKWLLERGIRIFEWQ